MPDEIDSGLDEQLGVLVGLNLSSIWSRMRDKFLAEWERLDRTGVSGDEMVRALEAFARAEGEVGLRDVARTAAGVSYNQGRSAEILKSGVKFVLRSELLDGATCEPCRLLDGAIIEVGSPGYLETLPPAQCLGGDRCRGFYVPLSEKL